MANAPTAIMDADFILTSGIVLEVEEYFFVGVG